MTKPEPTKKTLDQNQIEISFPLEAGRPTKERQTVRCIIEHWGNGRYLVIKEKKFDGITTLLGGGIEEDQAIEEAVESEIREESGYTDIKSIIITPFKVHNKFYNKKKEQNQYSIISLAIVELKSGASQEKSQEEIDLIDLKWVVKADLLDSVDTDMDKFFIEKFLDLDEKTKIQDSFALIADKKLLGQGLQFKVYEFDNRRVYKIPNTQKEAKDKLNSWGVVDPVKLKTAISRNNYLTNMSFKFILQSGLPFYFIGNPVFLDNLEYTQDLLQIPQYQIDKSDEYILDITQRFASLVKILWTYGLHERAMNFLINCGLNADNELIYADFGEFSINLQRTKKSIRLKRWHNSHNITSLPKDLRAKVLTILDAELTMESLKSHWKINLKPSQI